MLSLNYINPDQAGSYYNVLTRSQDSTPRSHADYYTRKAGEWYGKTAAHLGLQGIVSKEHFERLLNGQSKSGQELVQAGVNGTRRSGYDYTFSASKSFSLLTELIANPELKSQLHEAHDHAVKKALDYLERHYGQARLTVAGETRPVATGNLLYATFTENTSREQDPQVHTHAIIFNITRRHDGEFRAISNEPIHDNKMLLGQLYRNQLAKQLGEMGFAIEPKPKGLYELKGIPEKVLQEFSRRSEQIERALESMRQRYPAMEETKLRELAALETRGAKKDVPAGDLRRDWHQRLAEFKLEPEQLLEKMTSQKTARRKTENHIDAALEIMTEQESVVTREKLLETAMRLSIGQKTINDLEREMQSSKSLRTVVENRLYTSRQIQQIERDIVRQVKHGRNRHQPLLQPAQLSSLMAQQERLGLTRDQRTALAFLMTSRDGLVGVQGDAGTGKTTMLSRAAEQYQGKGYEVVTLAPTARAVAELRARKMPNAETVHSFLLTSTGKQNERARVFIVDEASMLGSRHLGQILDRTMASDRLVLVGDSKQKQSLAAGGIFTKLQVHQVMQTARMAENVRQKDPLAREVATQLAERKVGDAFNQLDGAKKIKEIADNQTRLQTAATEYLTKHSKNTVIIVESNRERKDLNNMIRQQLQTRGHLGRVRLTAMTRQPGNVPLQERQLSQTYKSGDSFFLSQRVEDVSAGSGGRVVHVDQMRNTIDAIVRDKGSSVRRTIDLNKDGHRLSRFKEELRCFARGDKIVFLKNDKRLAVENGTTARVTRVNPLDHSLTVLTDRKQRIVIDPNSYPYIDYGYATTNYKVQGLTAEEVLYVADTRTNPSYNSLYVAATRGKHGLDIFTNDKQVLRDKVQMEEVKSSNLDHDLEPQLQMERTLDRERID